VVAEADYRIKLPVFEGPLDLLLFLIRKNELDIYAIPIDTVTRQYLEVIYAMKELQLEVAGEFFVMAATLMEIKSRMLLPRHQQAVDPNAEEDDLDPRWELVHQLLQYKKFKEASSQLAGPPPPSPPPPSGRCATSTGSSFGTTSISSSGGWPRSSSSARSTPNR